MNKLALALATVAALGLGTAAFAQTSTTASTPQQRVQYSQSKTHVTKHMKKRHPARLYASHKAKQVVKHAPATKTVKAKVSS